MKKRNHQKTKKAASSNKQEMVRENAITEKEKKSFFHRWFRWDVITGIATILMLIIASLALIPTKPVDKIKNHISENIAIVEKTFNPKALIQENDSSLYISLIGKLQQNTLDYCVFWKTINESEPYSKYSDLDPSEIVAILSKEFDRSNKLNEAAFQIISSIKDILEYEIRIDSTHVTSVSQAKQADILKYVEIKNKVTSDSQQKCLVYLTEANKMSKQSKDYKKLLKKGLEALDDVKKEEDYYQMDDKILDYAIECNKLFNVSKRYYVDK